jgi:hypothetical protein
MFKKFTISLISLSLLLGIFSFGLSVKAQEVSPEQFSEKQKLEIILFHLDTCPHCKDEIKFLDKKILSEYGDYIDLKMYEVSSARNADIFRQYGVYYMVQTELQEKK